MVCVCVCRPPLSRSPSLCTRLFRLRLSWVCEELCPSLSPKRCSTPCLPSGNSPATVTCLSLSFIHRYSSSISMLCVRSHNNKDLLKTTDKFDLVSTSAEYNVLLNLLQVSGVHAPKPVSAQSHGALWWSASQRAVFCFSRHAAVRHGQAAVRISLPAHERQPAAGVRRAHEPGGWDEHVSAHGLAAHSGKSTAGQTQKKMSCGWVLMWDVRSTALLL